MEILEAEKLYRKYTISDVVLRCSYLSVSGTTCTRRNYNGRRKEANFPISLSRRMMAICFQWFLQMLGGSRAPGGTIESFVTIENDRRLDLLPRSLL